MITTNARDIASSFAQRAEALHDALARGIRNIAVAVDNAQVKNLVGSNTAEPGTYPVPARTGHLLGAHFFNLPTDTLAIVGNSATYAVGVHDGRGSSKKFGARPFLDEAAASVDHDGIMGAELDKVYAL